MKIDNMELIYWSVRSSSRRTGDGIKRIDGGVLLFSQATSITLLKYMKKVWCNIQVIIYRLQLNKYHIFLFNRYYIQQSCLRSGGRLVV